MNFCKQSFSLCPVRISPKSSVNGKLAKSRNPNFSLNNRAYYKGADSYGKFTQFHIGFFYCNCIITCGNKTYSATNRFALNATNDEFTAFAHSIDYIGKSFKEMQPFFFILNCNQFIKTCSGTKCSVSGAPQH